MKRLNNKGFTLIELVATIVILAVVMGIGSYAITGIISRSKEEDYKLLIEEIKSAVELYYQECKYYGSDNIICPELDEGTGYYSATLGTLVNYGYLKGNGTNSDNKMILVNPNNDVSITMCVIRYKYNDGDFDIESVVVNEMDESIKNSCPSTDDYSQ